MRPAPDEPRFSIGIALAGWFAALVFSNIGAVVILAVADESGTDFNDLPLWQKRGIGLYWETYQKESLNPKTGEKVLAPRRRVKIDDNLPMKDAYGGFILNLTLTAAT